jgi:ADP-ribose pyrophosphatase
LGGKRLNSKKKGEGMNLIERKRAEELVYDGTLLKIWRTQVELENGQEAVREWIKHPGAAAVIPVFPNGDTLLVRQFRYPVGRETLEIPAGKIDPGETPLECAVRELSEETGLVAGDFVPVGTVITTPGFTNEEIHLYVCQNPSLGPAHPDDGELIGGIQIPLAEVFRQIMDERIKDGKTVMAFLLARAKGLI